jgi:hypothetical protein
MMFVNFTVSNRDLCEKPRRRAAWSCEKGKLVNPSTNRKRATGTGRQIAAQ